MTKFVTRELSPLDKEGLGGIFSDAVIPRLALLTTPFIKGGNTTLTTEPSPCI